MVVLQHSTLVQLEIPIAPTDQPLSYSSLIWEILHGDQIQVATRLFPGTGLNNPWIEVPSEVIALVFCTPPV